MTFSGLRGRSDRPSAPTSVAVFGVASALCAVAALVMAGGQWPDDTAPLAAYVPALVLASLGLLGAILCAGFACLIAAIARRGS